MKGFLHYYGKKAQMGGLYSTFMSSDLCGMAAHNLGTNTVMEEYYQISSDLKTLLNCELLLLLFFLLYDYILVFCVVMLKIVVI